MQLRRFTADSTPAALGAVRLSLGDDAIILANRKIGDQVEIIATAHMDDVEALANVSESVEDVFPKADSLDIAGSKVKSPAQDEARPNAMNEGAGNVIEMKTKSANNNENVQSERPDTANLLGDSSVPPKSNASDALTIEQLKAAIESAEKQASQSSNAHQSASDPADAVKVDANTQSLKAKTQQQSPAESVLKNKTPEANVRSDQAAEEDDALTVILGSTDKIKPETEKVATELTDTKSQVTQFDADELKQEIKDVSLSMGDAITSNVTDAIASSVDVAIAAQSEHLMQIIDTQNELINQHFKGLEVNLWGNNAPYRREHLQKLLSLGLGAQLAVQLVERASPKHTVDEALRHSFALLKSTLPIGMDKTGSVAGVTVVSGPPGAGKTTVLMKMATQHVKEHGADSIVVICADTRRIGAFEELQAYGRLLGVPTVHAHDTTEFESLIEAFSHKQLVLVDHTLPLDADAVEIPKSLLNTEAGDSVRHLLVLAATSQSAMVDALVHRHCKDRSMQCVLTHLDASARLGELFNPIIRHHLPIAYWSDAASIQTPLQKADASILIATAVAMSRRLDRNEDDECLLRLIQPTDDMMRSPVNKAKKHEISET